MNVIEIEKIINNVLYVYPEMNDLFVKALKEKISKGLQNIECEVELTIYGIHVILKNKNQNQTNTITWYSNFDITILNFSIDLYYIMDEDENCLDYYRLSDIKLYFSSNYGYIFYISENRNIVAQGVLDIPYNDVKVNFDTNSGYVFDILQDKNVVAKGVFGVSCIKREAKLFNLDKKTLNELENDNIINNDIELFEFFSFVFKKIFSTSIDFKLFILRDALFAIILKDSSYANIIYEHMLFDNNANQNILKKNYLFKDFQKDFTNIIKYIKTIY